MLHEERPSTTAVFERTSQRPYPGDVPTARHATPASSAPLLHVTPVDPVAAAVATVNATLRYPAFATAMAAALSRRPARNAHDLAKLARQVLVRQFDADLAGTCLTVTWDAVAHTNVVRAEASGHG